MPADVVYYGMESELRIASLERVWSDENHNAFTDLCRFRGALYLTFRSCPDGHPIASSAFIRILRSPDGGNWQQVFSFSVPERDTRDPHFLVFDDQLLVYSGTWSAPSNRSSEEWSTQRNLNEQMGYVAKTADGSIWEGPIELPTTKGYYIWRAAAYGGIAYLCGRRKRGFVNLESREEEYALQESVMLASENGIHWHPHALFQEAFGDETAFLFDESGHVTALARARALEMPGQICTAAPPYTQWERTSIDHNIGGPMIARWGGDIIGAGRRMSPGLPHVTELYRLRDRKLEPALTLPSGGDNSYPGFVEIDSKRALLSYYSSHQGHPVADGRPGERYPASIYIAKIVRG